MKRLLMLGLALLAMPLTSSIGIGPEKTDVHGVGWFDSFDDARIEARRTGKPILFLSMFGSLGEEMPCANARTLRATLFRDPRFLELVKSDVIPAWEMVRAVPKVTIDLGEGEKIVRTVRGNAVLYLCNPDGTVVDAYPGVYTADDFLPMVRESIAELIGEDFEAVREYHKARGRIPEPTRITMGKMMLESPTLELIGAPATTGANESVATNDPDRQRFIAAAMRLSDASLTPRTVPEALALAAGPSSAIGDATEVAAEILRRDSELNMTRTRPVVHLFFASEKRLPTPMEARDAILETILKIPYKDPYFGLRDVLLPGTPR
ncbi:MAG: hypothetical protein KIT74_10145 [Fimbriimonadales bacterium]|nr:hypothetical protein [Fimbriimonadales bacterium]